MKYLRKYLQSKRTPKLNILILNTAIQFLQKRSIDLSIYLQNESAAGFITQLLTTVLCKMHQKHHAQSTQNFFKESIQNISSKT